MAKSGSTRSTLAPVFALAIGAAGRDAAEPLGAGLAERLARPARVSGAARHAAGRRRTASGQRHRQERRPVADASTRIKGNIGGGEATADHRRQTGRQRHRANARIQLNGVDGAALRYRGLAMPNGRASLQMTLASQGRSASALTGALSGSGTVTLESAAIAGLDPRAFEVAIRASDGGQATDDNRLRQLVDPVLSAGALSVASAQIPFTIRDGRLRVGATTLDAEGARAIVSGGYDIPADQADIRASRRRLTGMRRQRPSGNPDCSRRVRPTARPHRRCLGAVVLAGGARDRSRDQAAGFIERGEPPPRAGSDSTGRGCARCLGGAKAESPRPGRAAAAPRPIRRSPASRPRRCRRRSTFARPRCV